MPIYNENPAFLELSIASLANQTDKNFECIFVDDSTDKFIEKICQRICTVDQRFFYVKNKIRIGLAASLNKGISIARAPLIARFDSDDICDSNRFKKQLDYLSENPEIGVLGGAINIIDSQGNSKKNKFYPLEQKKIENAFIYKNAIAHPTVIFRKKLINNFGGYDESYTYAEDLELWLRFLKNGVKFANLEDILIYYRDSNKFRSKDNWVFNLRARYKNFYKKNFYMKIISMLMIALWMLIPEKIKNLLKK